MSQRGFTLLELLIALAISAIVAFATFRLLNNSVTVRDGLQQQSEFTSKLARAMRFIETDITQLNPARTVRNAFNEQEDAIMLDFEGLSLTRGGWVNSTFYPYERSTLQRIRYRIAQPGSELCPNTENSAEGGCLIRSFRTHLDDDGSLLWRHQQLLPGITELEWRFLIFNAATNAREFTDLPPQESPATGTVEDILYAVEMTLEVNGQTHQRLFQVPRLPTTETEETS